MTKIIGLLTKEEKKYLEDKGYKFKSTKGYEDLIEPYDDNVYDSVIIDHNISLFDLLYLGEENLNEECSEFDFMNNYSEEENTKFIIYSNYEGEEDCLYGIGDTIEEAWESAIECLNEENEDIYFIKEYMNIAEKKDDKYFYIGTMKEQEIK
jgi:hypothetical protein